MFNRHVGIYFLHVSSIHMALVWNCTNPLKSIIYPLLIRICIKSCSLTHNISHLEQREFIWLTIRTRCHLSCSSVTFLYSDLPKRHDCFHGVLLLAKYIGNRKRSYLIHQCTHIYDKYFVNHHLPRYNISSWCQHEQLQVANTTVIDLLTRVTHVSLYFWNITMSNWLLIDSV